MWIRQRIHSIHEKANTDNGSRKDKIGSFNGEANDESNGVCLMGICDIFVT